MKLIPQRFQVPITKMKQNSKFDQRKPELLELKTDACKTKTGHDLSTGSTTTTKTHLIIEFVVSVRVKRAKNNRDRSVLSLILEN